MIHGQTFQQWFVDSYMFDAAGMSPAVNGFFWCVKHLSVIAANSDRRAQLPTRPPALSVIAANSDQRAQLPTHPPAAPCPLLTLLSLATHLSFHFRRDDFWSLSGNMVRCGLPAS